MTRPRVVIDTNVVISAALKPQGTQALVLQLVAFTAVEMCVSEPIVEEYREVFSRPKFSHLDPAGVSRLLSLVGREATMIEPPYALPSPNTIPTIASTNAPIQRAPTTSSPATSVISSSTGNRPAFSMPVSF